MDLRDEIYNTFEKDLDKAVDNLLQKVKVVMDKIDRQAGNLVANEDSLAYLQAQLGSMQKVLAGCGYTEAVNKITDAMHGLAKDVIAGMSVIDLSFAAMDKSQILALIDWQHEAMTQIGASAFNGIKAQISTGVMSGMKEKELIANIEKSLLESNAGMARYAKTYADTGLHLYMQKVTMIGLDEFGVNSDDYDWEYIGVRDGKNREECILGLEKQIFTYAEMMDFEVEYGIRWNCRHEFQPVEKGTKPDKTAKDVNNAE